MEEKKLHSQAFYERRLAAENDPRNFTSFQFTKMDQTGDTKTNNAQLGDSSQYSLEKKGEEFKPSVSHEIKKTSSHPIS